MIAIMWQFEVKAGSEAEFEELYGVEGEWTTLNRHTRSYLGASFLHDHAVGHCADAQARERHGVGQMPAKLPYGPRDPPARHVGRGERLGGAQDDQVLK